MKIDFCVPAYNEDAIFPANSLRIWQFLQGLSLEHDWRLVFIVNGSSPAFQKLVQDFTEQNRPRAVCFIVEKAGKGRAIKTYFNTSNADILVYMDIDLAVDLDDLPRLLAPILVGGADLSFGSRMLPNSVKCRSWFRESSSRIYLHLSRFLLHHNFSDLQCGFKAIKAEAWHSLSAEIEDDAWFFDTELIYRAQKKGWRLQEIAVNWSENRYSRRRSKVKVWREAWTFLRAIIHLRQTVR